jgi:3-oxoadipate enol-lactonase
VSPRHLLLLHGQPGLGADWQPVIARLPDSLSAIAPDRPGHGSSPLRGGGLDVNAAAALDALDSAGVDRAVLVGHSYGGGVALRVAATAPDRVDALILLASVGPDCLNFFDWLLAAPVAGALASRVAWQVTPAFARAALRQMRRRDGGVRHPNWEVWGHARWDNGPQWRTFLAEQRALVREAPSFAALAASAEVPALVVTDPRDPLVPFKTAVALSGTLPDARLHLIEGAGHHLPLRAPDEVARQIVAFLETLDAEPVSLGCCLACPGQAGTEQAGSERAYLLGLRPLGPLAGGELDPLVLLEAAEAVREDGRVVHEDVRAAVVGRYEAVALC